MPTEISDVEKFIEMSAKATYCAVKTVKGGVKLKLRTPKQLYTLKIEPGQAEDLTKRLQCEVREI